VVLLMTSITLIAARPRYHPSCLCRSPFEEDGEDAYVAGINAPRRIVPSHSPFLLLTTSTTPPRILALRYTLPRYCRATLPPHCTDGSCAVDTAIWLFTLGGRRVGA